MFSGCRGRDFVLALVAALAFQASSGLADEALLPAPVSPPPPLFDQSMIDHAVAELDDVVEAAMQKTGVPGVAVGVVYKDKVIFSKGFGIREVGKNDPIDVDTVFMLASVSKPIASTVVAHEVGEGRFAWDDPVRGYNDAFALHDVYVTENATFADLMSHRSGLHTGAGDLLEDLGFDRPYILSHLDQQPLAPFRSSYNYSNFGYTAGGIAAAVAAGRTWEDLADEVLFKPAGMKTASYRHSDYLGRGNRALIHKRLEDGTWGALYDRDPDAEAPAGGASASLDDMLRFLRLQLGGGVLDGKRIVDGDALATTHVPHMMFSPPASVASRAGFYALGWNVGYDDQGRVRLSHSGAFALGTATNITFMPGEDVGIVVLTNGEPIGLAEAIANSFLDIAQNGRVTVDWLGFFGAAFAAMEAAESSGKDYAKPPPDAAPGHELAAYEGTYGNSYYGPLVVSVRGERLEMALGPSGRPVKFALDHYDGDTFTFESIGENSTGLSGANFRVADDGHADRVVLEFYDTAGLGTFIRE